MNLPCPMYQSKRSVHAAVPKDYEDTLIPYTIGKRSLFPLESSTVQEIFIDKQKLTQSIFRSFCSSNLGEFLYFQEVQIYDAGHAQ